MFEPMVLAKILVTAFTVVILSLVADRAGPRIAGILSGYPAGTAITLYFYGLEIGPQFASDSAVYNVLGLTATLAFIYVYYRVTSRQKAETSKYHTIALATAAAFVSFLGSSSLLQLLPMNRWLAPVITLGAIYLFWRLFKNIEDHDIEVRVKLTPKAIVLRAMLAATIVLAVTFAAKFLQPSWAGLFSAFPITMFPLLLIVHLTYDTRQAHTLIKNAPIGLVSLVLYSLSVSLAYPLWGINLGTLISFAAATIYLIVYREIANKSA